MQIFFQVPQSHVAVLTRFGKFSRVLEQGLHARIPFLESIYYVKWGSIANKNGVFIELTEQILDTKPKTCHTKDNVPIDIDASIYWRITDVTKALFEVDLLPQSLIDSCLNALRAQIGKLTLDQVLSSRKELSEKIAVDLMDISVKWGVQISRVEIQEVITSNETTEAMRQEMAAERKKRANVLEAQGLAESKKLDAQAVAEAKKQVAEAEAYAIRVKAEAESEYISKLSELLGTEQVGKILMMEKTLDSYKEISSNSSNKVFLPSDIQSLIIDHSANS